MRQKQIAFSTLAIFVGFLAWASMAQAQQIPESRHWVVEAGPQLVQISAEGIHINQPDPKVLTYYGIVSTHVDLPAGKPWKIDFDLKFGQLRSAGVGIGLFNGSDLMGWVGADGWYKQMGCFVGKGDEVAAPQANTDWHKFEFSGDGTTVTIKEDGNVLGSGSQLGTPNTIKIGDINGSVQPLNAQPAKMLDGQQSEITVRNLQLTEAGSAVAKQYPAKTSVPEYPITARINLIPLTYSNPAKFHAANKIVSVSFISHLFYVLQRDPNDASDKAMLENDIPLSPLASDQLSVAIDSQPALENRYCKIAGETKVVTFKSSNDNVITCEANGTFNVWGPGDASVTIALSDGSVSIPFHIVQLPLMSDMTKDEVINILGMPDAAHEKFFPSGDIGTVDGMICVGPDQVDHFIYKKYPGAILQFYVDHLAHCWMAERENKWLKH